ncbi:MAG: 16S rRNA (guanine(527)-N(7))-methyltransferase RsmG [Oscillospiraceae bacterium]|jgi:16S rRNA (guanine527-N7)-methyltransferase|nr:16S rRNA (guanine(527)-N(7))-methyltransferase RsmG [Oscillospiraceae bacterium]
MTGDMGRFLALLLERNEVLNLTAVREPGEAGVRHIEDALAVYDLFPMGGMSLIDVGSGGGVPGIPLRLRDPSIRLTLLDATAKKVAFLREACDTLGLADVDCIAARAEEQARLPRFRDSFDGAIARGVARLPVLCELCLPFVRPGGVFLAMKGAEPAQEVADAEGILRRLSGRVKEILSYSLGDEIRHTLVLVEKLGPTPAGYPRSWAKIKREALASEG